MSDSAAEAVMPPPSYDLADAFEQLPVGVAIFDTNDDFACLRHNARFLTMIGAEWHTRGSFVGAALRDLLEADSYAQVRSIFEQVRASAAPFASDDYAAVMRSESQPRFYQWSLTPLRGPDGTVSALLASGIEITARKTFEVEAKASARQADKERALLDTLIGAAPIGVAFLDRDLRFVRINQRLAQLNGLPVAAHLGRRLSDLHPGLAASIEPVALRVLTTGQPVTNIEVTLPTTTATHHGGAWLKSYYPVPDASGAMLGVGVLVTDISDERRMQEDLRAITVRERERAADLEALLNAVPAAVWIAHDPECHSITGSREASRLLRMAPDSNLSKSSPNTSIAHFQVMRGGVELADEDLPVQQAARGIEVHDFEEDVVFADGTEITLLGNATPLRDDQGRVRGAVAAFLDITDRKLAERERARLYAAEQQARAEAEAALKLRDTFFSMAAHELKTPLTAMLGQVHLLERRAAQSGTLSERDQRSVQAIISQATRLNKLISAMLDVTRIEQGYLSLEREQVDIVALGRRVVDEIQPAHPRHHFFWRGPTAPLIISGDTMRLEQVLYNLVENAVKYSPLGGDISVSIDDNGRVARIRVRDQGIGISGADLPYLFERFYRSPGAQEQHIPGMGIGLHVVKEIVTLHGGDVAVESVVGEGSSFLVTLPIDSSIAEDLSFR